MRKSYSNAATVIVNSTDADTALEQLVELGFKQERIQDHIQRLNSKLDRRLDKAGLCAVETAA